MNFEKYISNLKSDDEWIIEETIDEISTNFTDEPEGEVRELLLKHCFHNGAYVRRVAIRTTAMHWAFPEAFPILERMLTGGEEDDEVLDAACGSIVCYKGSKKITDKEINLLFYKALKNELLSRFHREMIYSSFLRYHDLIDVHDYSASGINNNSYPVIDMDLVKGKIKDYI